jgi:hypothetical protein
MVGSICDESLQMKMIQHAQAVGLSVVYCVAFLSLFSGDAVKTIFFHPLCTLTYKGMHILGR